MVIAIANISRLSFEVQTGIFTGKNIKVILFFKGFGLQLKIRASPKISFSYAVFISIHMLTRP